MIYYFTVTGRIDAINGLEPVNDCTGEIVGFKLPEDGRVVKPAFCLDIYPSEDGDFEKVAYTYREMQELGIELLDYDRTDLEPSDSNVEVVQCSTT